MLKLIYSYLHVHIHKKKITHGHFIYCTHMSIYKHAHGHKHAYLLYSYICIFNKTYQYSDPTRGGWIVSQEGLEIILTAYFYG